MCYNRFMAQKKRKFRITFRGVMSVLTVFLVAFVIYQNWSDFEQFPEYLGDSMEHFFSAFMLLAVIPEQLFMYFACGQIFFSYLNRRREVRKFNNKEILKISTELNFVTRAIPAGGVSGLAYLTYRLKHYQVTAGQASFLYIFRYAITTVVNYLQALVAIVVLLLAGSVPDEAQWIIGVALMMNFGVFVALGFVIYMTSSQKRINFFARLVTNLANKGTQIVTFGHKKQVINPEKISNYFMDIHESVKLVKKNKRELKRPALWGVVYSLCEVGAYWLVAIALGQPGLLPYIMVGEAVGSVFDGIVPYGLYEIGMAGVITALLGSQPNALNTAVAVTVITRVLTLVFTIVSGIVPYYQALGRKKSEAESEIAATPTGMHHENTRHGGEAGSQHEGPKHE